VDPDVAPTGHSKAALTARRAYELVPGPSAVGAARDAADVSCEGLSPPLRETVRLLVSELVTNSVRHACADGRDPIVVRFAVGARSVRVAVTDHGPGFAPQIPHPDSESESGYGLYLVERLADRWGARDDGAMTVWFELARARALPLRPARLIEAVRVGRWLTRFCVRSVVRSTRIAIARRASARSMVMGGARHRDSAVPLRSDSPGDALRRSAGPTSTRPGSRTASS
jgi:anti-sigma regulatory factor (Ser/Thr protein kinase)